MTKLKQDDDTFIAEFQSIGPAEMARKYDVTLRNVLHKRKRIEAKRDCQLVPPTKRMVDMPECEHIDLADGTIIVGSDFHIWPGEESTSLRAFKKFVADMRPDVVVLNGDVLDLPRLSRHPMTWEEAPDPQQEIEAAQDHLNDIDQRGKPHAIKLWTRGNHDHRFELQLANQVPAFRNVRGTRLQDHFGSWRMSVSVMVNYGDERGRTMIKHRMAGGKHAVYNNVRESGCHTVTGHLHAQNVRSISDFRPYDLYSMDTGCVADKTHLAFLYTENRALDWRSGFGMLTYRDSRLMPPELITKWDNESVTYRGQVIAV